MAKLHCAVFQVGESLIAIPADRVQEMFLLPKVHRAPGKAATQRGLLQLREAVMPAIDLRVCLGLPSAATELDALLQMLTEREREHESWIAELEASVRERRAFGLATDPRKCKFGQWFYAFRTENAVLRAEVSRIEQPHASVHALASEIGDLRARGRDEEALARLAAARLQELAQVVHLFGVIRDVIRREHREIGVAIDLGGARVAAIVDSAEVVTELEDLAREDDPLRAGSLRADLVQQLASLRGETRPVMLLDLARLGSLVV